MSEINYDIKWMEIALQQARVSAKKGEVPVGAVLVQNNTLLVKSGNCPISMNDPAAHAEILVLREGGKLLQNYRLPGTVLYVTLEPCIMCAGALLHARVSRVVYGAKDPKTGALHSRYSIGNDGLLNHQLEVTGGILEEECSALLTEFFRKRRKNNGI